MAFCKGSTGLLALMGTLTIVTNVVFIVLCYVLSFLGQVRGRRAKSVLVLSVFFFRRLGGGGVLLGYYVPY